MLEVFHYTLRWFWYSQISAVHMTVGKSVTLRVSYFYVCFTTTSLATVGMYLLLTYRYQATTTGWEWCSDWNWYKFISLSLSNCTRTCTVLCRALYSIFFSKLYLLFIFASKYFFIDHYCKTKLCNLLKNGKIYWPDLVDWFKVFIVIEISTVCDNN